MKKTIAYLLTVFVLTGLLTGCGGEQGSHSTENETKEEPADAGEAADLAASDSTLPASEGNTAASERAEVSEPEAEKKLLNIYCIGEDFKSRVQDYYPDYEPSGDDTGRIADTEVRWHIYTDEAEYRETLDEKLERQLAGLGSSEKAGQGDSAFADTASEGASFERSGPVEPVSPEDRVDLYVVEENYLRDYVEKGYSLDVMGDVGLTAQDLADQFPYTQQMALDQEGRLKAVTWQATPGVFAYRRSIAREVLGTDDPEKVQEAVSDWESFAQTAELAAEEGYYMLSGYNDAYQVYADNVSSPWVEDGYLNIDPHLEEWAVQTREFAENGYIHGTEQWSDEWKEDHTGDGEVFGFFYSSWGIQYTLQSKAEGNTESEDGDGEGSDAASAAGDYAICKGPEPSHFGGQWIAAAPGNGDRVLIRSILQTMTCDPAVMKKITSDIHEFTNTVSGMKELAESDYKAEVLGGQNPLPIFVEVAQALNQRYLTSYDDDLDTGFQVSMQDYFLGRTSQTDALELFRKVALGRYEELMDRGDEEMEEEEE